MEFINNGKPIKIRIGKASDCYWRTIQNGEKIVLPVEVGKRYCFVRTTKGQLNGQTVETKQIELNPLNQSNFLNELISIKGIGKKTAEDIFLIFETEEILREHIKNDDELPVRNDVEDLLRRIYG